jgi:F-type H+-transporting ATPase subunit epsilon
MQFQLLSSKGLKYDGEAYEVIVPTLDGTIAVFANHMPLISAAAPGVVSVRKKAGDSDADMENYAVAGGALQVDGQTVRFLSDDITASDEVNEQTAEAAQNRAEELMSKAESQVALHEAKRMLQHSTAQLHVARLKKRHHR